MSDKRDAGNATISILSKKRAAGKDLQVIMQFSELSYHSDAKRQAVEIGRAHA